MAHTYLVLNAKKEVLELVTMTMVVIYDHSYQRVKGVEGLTRTRTWAQRLDDAFVSEADQHLLKAKYKGRTAYTDKLDFGAKIRDKYHWLDKPIPMFVYFNNAGGHGTDEVVESDRCKRSITQLSCLAPTRR